MPSNYGRIASDNIKRRGTEFSDIGELLADKLYSDPSHFVFELLQNAEDALARRRSSRGRKEQVCEVSFKLMPDRLEMRHFGAMFTPADVKGICDVLRGTKAEDVNQIGRFGIGFKSVYTVTASPEIHSGNEHFRIDGYIRPKAVLPRPTEATETLFVFPFNHPTLSASAAFELIHNRLMHLGMRTLLFLRHIHAIHWESEDQNNGGYSRKSTPFKLGRRVEISGHSHADVCDEEWIVFERMTKHSTAPIEVAFQVALLDAKGTQEQVKPLSQSELFVFFPTEKQLDVGFLLNGPFLTTPARDNIIRNKFNNDLIEEAAHLIADTLTFLKNIKLLSVEALEAFPLRRDHFPVGDPFHPIFVSVLNALQTPPLIPTDSDRFVEAKTARIASSAEMRALISERQLGQLLSADGNLTWVSSAITRERAALLRPYLEQELGIVDIRPESFIRQLSEEFLLVQSDDWVVQFYEFLLSQRALWSGDGGYSLSSGQLRLKPIFRLAAGSHVAFARPPQPANVFLPPNGPTAFPTIRRKIAANPNARQFLEEFGLKEPDIVDEVFSDVLPKYLSRQEKPSCDGLSPSSYGRDIARIASALDSGYTPRKLALMKTLQDTSFVRASNAVTNVRALATPREVYFRSPDLERYFEGNGDAWFVDESVRYLKKIAVDLRVATEVRVQSRVPDSQGFVSIQSDSGHHCRGIHRFDPDATIHGLEHALDSVNLVNARYIWNRILVPNVHLLRGDVQTSSRKNFDRAKSVRQLSSAGTLLTERRWLPDKNGEFRKPKELTLHHLPKGFDPNEALSLALGMDSSLYLVVQHYGIRPDLLRFFVENASAQQYIEELQAKMSKSSARNVSKQPTPDIVGAVNEIFAKSRGTTIHSSPLVERPIADPALRRERTREEIELKKADSPAEQNSSAVSMRRNWIPKDDAIHSFLLEEYRGQCQICDSVFPKRDGSPYFEGLYLLSRADHAWLDVAGNVLCLCPTCCTKVLHGTTVSNSPVGDQIQRLLTRAEGGITPLSVSLTLCGRPVMIQFTERHLIEIQSLMAMSLSVQP